MITRVRRANAELRKGFASVFSNGIIVKCCQGIVYGRIHYAGLTVRGTGPNITASRLPEEAPLLANRHDNTLL